MDRDYLDILESEAVYILREVAGQFRRPVILFSGGKDSTLLLWLARKAFYPLAIPFSVMHIDTGHNFEQALEFRDRLVADMGLAVIVRKVEDSMKQYGLLEPAGRFPSRNALQSVTLMDAIREFEFDACIGGGRRDEEKARAKERIFSLRNEAGAWQPHAQRPEVWDLYNGRLQEGEHIRAFPLSNWSELDVWRYIQREQIPLPGLYFAHRRQCIRYQGRLVAVSEFAQAQAGDEVVDEWVRYRTVGDMTCTAAVDSQAMTVEAVIAEIEQSQLSERGETRMDDQISDAGMEDRKLKGYF